MSCIILFAKLLQLRNAVFVQFKLPLQLFLLSSTIYREIVRILCNLSERIDNLRQKDT